MLFKVVRKVLLFRENLVADGELCAYQHDGFWQCMDTKREKEKLEGLAAAGKAPWMVWEWMS